MCTHVYFIKGRSGTGKLSYFLDNIKEKSGRKGSIILIPNSETLHVEKSVAKENLSGKVDILTFPLVCRMIFNYAGGNNKKKISSSAKKLLMYSILTNDSKDLSIYGNISKNDIGTIEKMLSLHKEFAVNNISNDDILKAANVIENKNAHLKDKLVDFATIFKAFDDRVDERWFDSDKDKRRASEKQNDCFEGKDIYIYGFTSFENDELLLLGNIFKQSRDIYVSLAYDKIKDENTLDFISQKKLEDNIKSVCSSLGKEIEYMPDILLCENKKYSSDELSFLSNNIFSKNSEAKYNEELKDIKVYRCSSKIEECFAVGYDISSEIFNAHSSNINLMYGDIAVVCENTEDYQNVLKQVFEKLDIPYYLVDQTDINSDPIVSFINTTFDCIAGNFKNEDVIKLVKNGYFNIDEYDKDLFEKYVYKWNISGYSKYKTKWENSPLGFETKETEYLETILNKVNAIREKIYEYFFSLVKYFDKKEKLIIQSQSLYEYLEKNNVPNYVIKKANEMYEEDYNAASRLYSLWQSICKVMDEIIETLGEDFECTFNEYIQLFKLSLSDVQLKPDQTTIDRVIFGSVGVMRPSNIKRLYLIGANEGVFPKDAKESKFLSDKEKRYLIENTSLTLTNVSEKRRCDELDIFYKTLCLPNEKLTITYAHYKNEGVLETKSSALDKMEILFPKLKEILYRELDTEKIWKKEHSIEILPDTKQKTKLALISLFKQSEGEHLLEIGKNLPALKVTKYNIDDELLSKLFANKKINLSYSKIESYLRCEYRYYCETFLKLYDDERAEFGINNIGSAMHKILENSIDELYKLKKEGNLDNDKFEEAIVPIIESSTSEYLDEVHYHDKLSGPLQITIDQIKKSAYKILSSAKKTIYTSKFEPMYYELRIADGSDGKYTKPLKLEDENSIVALNGFVDRVDIYEKDGKNYVKIIDYKSSDKEFKIDNIKKGINTQMMLYLYSICENGILDGENKVLDEKTIVPAGVVYLTASSRIENKDKEKEKLNNALINKDPMIEEAFKDEGIETDETFTFSSDDNTFLEIKKELQSLVLNTVSKIKKGEANTYDKNNTVFNNSPCNFCTYKDVCKNAKITSMT